MDVYYILNLRSSIVSIGQLDERGCEVLIESGILKIQDRERSILAKVKRSHNRLYLLDLKVEHDTPRSHGCGMPDSAISASTC